VKRWICDRMPGHLFREPGHVRCPACRELPEAEHAAALADEFVKTYHALGYGVPPQRVVVEAVFADLLERKVIE